MNILKNIFSISLFFVSGIIVAVSVLTLTIWGKTRFDYLLMYMLSLNAVGNFFKYSFLCLSFISGVFFTFISFKLSLKNKLILFLGSIAFFVYTFGIVEYIYGIGNISEIYEKEYVSPAPKADKEKRNLIVLYLESLEDNYKNYDGQGTNLIPNLSKIAQENSSFNGFQQLFFSNATISAQVAGLCGLIYKNEFDAKNLSVIINNTLPRATCYSDILRKENYNTYFIQGTSVDFANTRNFMRQHGFGNLYGSDELDKNSQYRNSDGWGIKDSVLYEISKRKILELAQEKRPFLVVISTFDTHPPVANLDKSCAEKFGDDRDTIVCADQMAADFITWIQKQDFYRNTTIVAIGDHIQMGGNSIYPDKQKRKIFNVIVNPVSGLVPQEHEWVTFDLAPTILEAIGYNSGKFGLGRSLWKEEPTLFEKYGSSLDIEFQKNSAFYKSLSKPAKELPPAQFSDFQSGQTVKGNDIKAYAAEYINVGANQFGAVWANNLNFKINGKIGKYLCFKTDFLLISQNAKEKNIIDIFANNQKIEKWVIDNDEKKPFERSLCFNSGIIGDDKKLSLKFIRNTQSNRDIHYVIGFREITLTTK